MKEDSVGKLIGKFCKIVTKESGEEKTNVVTGMLLDFDRDSGFVVIESANSVFYLNIETIVAIKPRGEFGG